MWIADKIAYRGEENFSMAYKGRVLVWFKEGTNIIHYTSTDGQVINPGTGGVLGGFGANIVSNTYENGVGTIVFDGPVRAIAGSGFSNKSTLLSIDIPSTVTDLRAWCFSNCSSLTSLYIPANVRIFYLEWLENCPGLQSITVDPNNQKYMDLGCNGIYYYDRDGYLVLEAGCKNTIIHRNTYSIDTAAFKGCSSLTSINLANVHFIGIDAFKDCSRLVTVAVNATTPPTLGTGAFDGCSPNLQIKVPAGSVQAYKTASGWSKYASKIVSQ